MSFEVKDQEGLRRLLVTLEGGNPDAQQTLNEFLKFNNNIERTNLPRREDVQRMLYADYAGKTLFPGLADDPFTLLADSMAISFMAKGGDKSKQFVELMKQTPSLADLQSAEAAKTGIMDRLFNRGGAEE